LLLERGEELLVLIAESGGVRLGDVLGGHRLRPLGGGGVGLLLGLRLRLGGGGFGSRARRLALRGAGSGGGRGRRGGQRRRARRGRIVIAAGGEQTAGRDRHGNAENLSTNPVHVCLSSICAQ